MALLLDFKTQFELLYRDMLQQGVKYSSEKTVNSTMLKFIHCCGAASTVADLLGQLLAPFEYFSIFS